MTEPKKKPSKSSISGKIISIAAFLIGFTIVGAIFNHNHSTSQPSNYLTDSTSARPYTSAQYGFSINFPGNPTVSDSTIKVQGVSVPYTSYERDNNNGNTDFQVSIDAYPSDFDMSDVKARLEGALNGEAENTKGATLVSSSYGTLVGYTSITGHISVNTSGQTFDMYDTSLLKGNTLYNITTIGATEQDFNNFANSFQFTQ